MAWLETLISGVSTPWANRIKLTIDSSKVDENLTDFPILIHLGSSAGTNNRDLSTTVSGLAVSGAYRYWRMYQNSCTRACSNNYEWHFGYMGFYESTDGTGTNLLNSGNISVSSRRSPDPSWPLGNVTFVFANEQAGEWVQMDYGTAVVVRSMRYKNQVGSSWAPTSTKVQYSNDGIVWLDAETFSDNGSTSTQTFEVPELTIVYKKFAITSSDGDTQQYVEIEDFNASSGEAWLWTKVPTVYSGIDTVLYFYYDDRMPENTTYVGNVGDTPAMNVWTNNFSAVWHLNNNPTGGSGAIKDSTTSPNNGTPGGSMTSNDSISAVIGKGLDFDGSNDYVDFSNSSNLSPGTGTFCVSAVIKKTSSDTTGQIYSDYGSNSLNYIALRISSDNRAYGRYRDGSSNDLLIEGQIPNLNDSNFHYLASIRDSQTTSKLWIDDGTYNYTNSSGSIGNINTSDGDVPRIGALSGNSQEYFGGIIDEVRVSNTSRSNAWCKADYYSCFDGLISYSVSKPAPTFGFTGYVKVGGVAAVRSIGLYRRSTMELIDSGISRQSDGYFALYTPYNDYHFVIILPGLTDGYNLLPYDKIHPEN